MNSLKVRLPQVLQWLETNPVDVLCIQETKLTDDKFPQAEIEAAGYHVAYTGQKTYNGVAFLDILCRIYRKTILSLKMSSKNYCSHDTGYAVICAYVPNGQALDSDKFQYKLQWLKITEKLGGRKVQRYPNCFASVITISPRKIVTYMTRQREGMNLVSPEERAALQPCWTWD
jgi:exodeoxyribonuclease-3